MGIHVWLLLLCCGQSTIVVGALHLTGTWNSQDFFVFLTKFGFQKTDPKEQENTQGFIYGNITLLNNVNTTHDLTLVVVDSEYFLEYYGNSTIQNKGQACDAMFIKIDTIAFNYICKPKGLEDFLRRIPCPRDRLCVDEDNPRNVVPGYQFTYKVRDVQRPRFWYLSFVSCFRDTSTKPCKWLLSEDSNIVISYDIWLVNGDPSVRGQNPFEHQFSFEFHDVFEIHVIAFIICVIIFLLWLYAFREQRHIATKLFTACICGEMLSISLNLIHVSIFAYNGVGAEWLGKVGTLLDLATQCVFMLLLLLLAKGLGITTDQFKWKSVIFSLWAAYTLLNVFLYIWNLVEIDNIISNTNEWQSWPGYATLACRVVVMFWFLYELRKTFGYTDREDMTFVMHFGAFFLVWFCYLPALALVTTQVSPLWRYKTIISINYAVDILAYAVLVHLFWPARSILYLVAGERPFETYDLEITGLLDDMQEMAIFNREEALSEIAAAKGRNQKETSTQQPSAQESGKSKSKKSRNGHPGSRNGRVINNGHLAFRDNSSFEDQEEMMKDS